MKKILIEGINGSLELNKKYIYIILNSLDKTQREEHIVWFDEIEDIIYKKPTKYKSGFISLYLSTRSFVTNKKKKYKLILNKIDEKSIESTKEIYIFIKEIIDNKKIKIVEAIDKEIIKDDLSKIEKDKIIKEEKTEKSSNTLEELKEIIKENNRNLSFEASSNEVEEIIELPNEENYYEEESSIPFINTQKEQVQDIFNEEIKEENYVYNIIDYDDIEEKIDYDLEDLEEQEEEQEEEKEEKQIKSISKLEDKVHELEKDLQTISYKEIILGEYIDSSYDKKKIDKLIVELNKLIEKIEKIKKEIKKQEKTISEDDFIKIEDGNVTILDAKKSLLDETQLEKYVIEYKDIIRKLDIVKKDTEELKKSSEEKKKEIGLSDDEYERKINEFKGIKSNKEFISKLIKDAKEDLRKVKWKIESTTEVHTKYKYVKKEISRRTRILAATAALNRLRPQHSRLSMMALSMFAGMSAIHDLLGYDLKKVEYNEIVQKEYLQGLEFVETDKARALIASTKEEIESIINECERKYSNYSGFSSLKKNLVSLKKDIDAQDKELREIEEKVKDYSNGPKMKVLRHVA